MMTLNYQVAGLSLSGTTNPGPQALDFTVGHLPLAIPYRITRADVQVSFDGGKTWRPARVGRLGPGRFRAAFAAPPAQAVELRISARDAAHGTIAETILRAYQTAAGLSG